MAVVLLTVIGAFFLAGLVAMIVGSRFRLDADEQRNDALNFVGYFLGALPIAFVIVFFGLG